MYSFFCQKKFRSHGVSHSLIWRVETVRRLECRSHVISPGVWRPFGASAAFVERRCRNGPRSHDPARQTRASHACPLRPMPVDLWRRRRGTMAQVGTNRPRHRGISSPSFTKPAARSPRGRTGRSGRCWQPVCHPGVRSASCRQAIVPLGTHGRWRCASPGLGDCHWRSASFPATAGSPNSSRRRVQRARSPYWA